MMNLHHLSVFHAVVQTGSVSRGAEALGISQPAVSKQLRLLRADAAGPPRQRRATDGGRG